MASGILSRLAAIPSGFEIFAPQAGASFAGVATVSPFGQSRFPTTRSRVIDAYLARWGYQVKGYFKALPNPADHPVFRVERLSGVDSERS
jgi:hypothetical protein